MLQTSAGLDYLVLLEENTDEIVKVLSEEPEVLSLAQEYLPRLLEYVPAKSDAEAKPVDPQFIKQIDKELGQFSTKASPALQEGIRKLRCDLRHFSGVTIAEGLARISR